MGRGVAATAAALSLSRVVRGVWDMEAPQRMAVVLELNNVVVFEKEVAGQGDIDFVVAAVVVEVDEAETGLRQRGQQQQPALRQSGFAVKELVVVEPVVVEPVVVEPAVAELVVGHFA